MDSKIENDQFAFHTPTASGNMRSMACGMRLKASTFSGSRSFAVAARPRVVPMRAPAIQAAMNVGDSLNDNAETFRVVTTDTGDTLQLSSFIGEKPFVLFFYPKAGTPGCTTEASQFRDRYDEFVDAGAEVLGISGDTQQEQAAFKQAQNLQYPLLCDQNDFLRKSFGVEGALFGFLPGRQTFVFDKEGKCVLSFNDMMNATAHIDEALKAVKALA